MGWWSLAKLLDPFGLAVVSELSKTWTATEKNTLLVGLQGSLLANRALWLGVALGVLAFTHLRFRFAHPSPGSRRSRGERETTAPGTTTVPRVRRTFGLATHSRQTFGIAWQSFRAVVTSWGGPALAFLPVLMMLSGHKLMEHLGIPLFPTTAQILASLADPQDFIWKLVPLLIVFFAGELVWREREAGLSEIADAVPVPDWVSFVGKLLGLSLVPVLSQALMMAAGMIVQAHMGYDRFEPGLYARVLPNCGIDASVVPNGTYFAQEWLPAIGYQPGRELQKAGDRRAYGLAARPEVPSLDDARARQDGSGGERMAFEAVVGTGEDQVAVAPGRLRRTWTKDGRRYFYYVADAPIRNEYAFFSAAYAVREARWNGVSIQIFHNPDHAWNLDRMVHGVEASLDSYTRQLGPYPQGQIRLVEHPGDAMTLHAAPINISYQEGFSLFNPAEGPRALDFPFAVVAHEVAHQWWGNQVTPAPVEGAPVLTESLAWYSALGVVEQTYGPEHLRRLLNLMREAYRTPRARAGVPLLRATDRFQAYRKGPFAMYALREYVGKERVNTALRRLLQKHGSGEPPLPTSLDLYQELQAVTPGSLRSLLADLFEKNTFWELAAERVAARQMETGNWQVTLAVRARKVVVDPAGAETEIPMNGLVEIGVFAAAEGGALGEPLYLRPHRVRSGGQRITVTVPGKPARAGIDPRNLLIDVKPADNLREVMAWQ